MNPGKISQKRRQRRKRRVRKKVYGTPARPRLSVSRSLKHICAQIIDDNAGVTLCQADSRDRGLRDSVANGGNVGGAQVVGKALAERAQARGITEVSFDRNGYKFHGRVKGLAEAARQGGLKF